MKYIDKRPIYSNIFRRKVRIRYVAIWNLPRQVFDSSSGRVLTALVSNRNNDDHFKQYGLVFAINSLGQIFFSPFSGKFAVKLGVKEVLCVGAIFEGLCGFLFAFLEYSQDVSYFIGFSCILRLIEGIAGTFRASTGIAILMALDPDKVREMEKTVVLTYVTTEILNRRKFYINFQLYKI